MKRDPRILTRAAETLIPKLNDPKHRAILQNYRLHALLEVSGRWREIFVPGMSVDRPLYRIGGTSQLEGPEVHSLYQSLVDKGTSIMILEPETLVVGDWGFASEAKYHTYITGETARARGHADADPAKKYVEAYWICMMWPYDDQARMIGEHTYTGAGRPELQECPDEEFIDLAEVGAAYAPLIEQARADLNATRAQLGLAAVSG
jgi:hypothetical protein